MTPPAIQGEYEGGLYGAIYPADNFGERKSYFLSQSVDYYLVTRRAGLAWQREMTTTAES